MSIIETIIRGSNITRLEVSNHSSYHSYILTQVTPMHLTYNIHKTVKINKTWNSLVKLANNKYIQLDSTINSKTLSQPKIRIRT